MNRLFTSLLLLACLLPSGCAQTPAAPTSALPPEATQPVEHPVQLIPLSGPASDAAAEISGLAWMEDTLILLPQYPTRMSDQSDGALLALTRQEIEDYLSGRSTAPLQPALIPFNAAGIDAAVPGYEGYEAIAFSGDRVYLTIEARAGITYHGFLASGQVTQDPLAVTIDPQSLQEIEPQAALLNRSDESLIIAGGRVLTFYESNGLEVNPSPAANVFSMELEPQEPIPFPRVEYRITDATAVDGEGNFWAINYFFPGDRNLSSSADPLVERYGEGPTHSRLEPVERLLAFHYDDNAITLLDLPPLQLELLEDEARNWEGIARLGDRGFLLVTDEFPTTLLAFVPLESGSP